MPYLNALEVESAILALSVAYPGQCEHIPLPNSTHEGRNTAAIRLANGPLDNRPAILFIGGQHAREWGSSDILVSFAADLLEAYDTGTGVGYGGKSYTASQVQDILDNRQVFIFACVNPDGRIHSQNVSNMWRRNRNPVAGVDLNRNFDFMWDFNTYFSEDANLVVSDNPNDPQQTYHGAAPNSEPETQNVIHILDTYPQIEWMIDIHSHGQLLYHNWGDDENQITDPSMNFLNPAFDGDRGVAGDSYREYIAPGDRAAQACLTSRMQSIISQVRGLTYSTGQSFDLYATSGTATDYPYSRHLVDGSNPKIHGFLLEWGTEFQPPYAEMENIILDISAALTEFSLAAPCVCSEVDVTLNTLSLNFNDIPEGEPTARTIVFSVTTCQEAHFEIISGPTVTLGPGNFGTLPSPTATLPGAGSVTTREARLWISHTGTNDGDITTGSVTVRLQETGEEWIIPISANTIARPTVGAVLVLDQSNSMTFPSGVTGFPTRNDILKFAAPVFVNVLQEDNGIGVVAFDHNAYDRMDVDTVGPPGFDMIRNNALGFIGTHTPNPAGSTAIGDGVENAHNLLMGEPYDHKAMIVFTDGHETDSKYISEVAPFIDDRVFAVGLGTAAQIQPTSLTALTNDTGGYLLLTGAMGSEDLFRLSKYYLQILAGVTNMDVVLDPEGVIKPGQEHTIPFYLNEADIGVDVILLGTTNLPIFNFHLQTPAGDIITPAIAAGTPSVDYYTAQGVSFYRMNMPVPIGVAGASAGKWNVILSVNEKYLERYIYGIIQFPEQYKDYLAHGIRYNLNVHSFSGLKMLARIQQTSLEPGATLILRSVLTEYGIPIGADRVTVWAEMERPDGTKANVQLSEESENSGIYIKKITASIPGVYKFRVLAKGKTLRKRDFTREQLLTGATWKGGDTPPSIGSGDPNGHGRDCICKLLKCLLSEKVLQPEFEKRLLELGINLKNFRKCVKACCRQ